MPVAPSIPCLILIVEDDRMVRETIALMLEEEYEVGVAVSVGSGLHYLNGLGAQQLGLILLDCLLPDGRLSDLLAEADRQEIPVILMSGDPEQAQKIDPNRRFLAKPFTQATLIAALDTTRG